MEKQGIIPHYLTAVALFLLAGTLFMVYLSIWEANKALLGKTYALASQEGAYAYSKLGEYALAMRNTAMALDIERMDMNEAAIALLRFADHLFSRYGAVMDGDITDNGQVLQIKMIIDTYPQDANGFINMLEDILSSSGPMAQFIRLNINETDNVLGLYVVNAELILTQPYYGHARDGGL